MAITYTRSSIKLKIKVSIGQRKDKMYP